MDYNSIQEFFTDYIKKYAPYQDNKYYQALMDYLLENFSKNIYIDIPKLLKELFEENIINIELYDNLLRGLGVPSELLKRLSLSDKVLFFNNLTDFYRYRGDIDFFTKVSKLFAYSTFDIYELYIDYDSSINDWVFKPDLIVKNLENQSDILSIDYNEVYNQIPSFLINKSQLDSYKDNNNLILPIKTNIVLLNYLISTDIGGLVNLINATFLKQYQNHTFDVYFVNDVIPMNLKTFYLIWHYILLRNYNTSTIGGYSLQYICEYSEELNPYSINDLDELINKYDSIKDALEARQFYKTYIEDKFRIYSQSIPYNHEDLIPFIDPKIIEYIDNRVALHIYEDTIVYNEILNEMLNSFLLSIYYNTDPYFLKYSEYFINSLTRILLNPKETSSYLLLNNFKPFHTELFTRYSDVLFLKSKLDTPTPNDKLYNFLFQLQNSDAHDILDYSTHNFIFQNHTSNIIIDKDIHNFNYKKDTIHNLTDARINKIQNSSMDLIKLDEYYNYLFSSDLYSSQINMINVIHDKFKYFKTNLLNLNDSRLLNYHLGYESVQDITEYYNYLFSSELYLSQINIFDDELISTKIIKTQLLNLQDKINKFESINNFTSSQDITEYYNYLLSSELYLSKLNLTIQNFNNVMFIKNQLLNLQETIINNLKYKELEDKYLLNLESIYNYNLSNYSIVGVTDTFEIFES